MRRELGNGFLVQSFRDSAFDLISAETIDFWNSEWPHANAAALTNMPLWTRDPGSLYFFYWSQLLNVSNSKRDLFLLHRFGTASCSGRGLRASGP